MNGEDYHGIPALFGVIAGLIIGYYICGFFSLHGTAAATAYVFSALGGALVGGIFATVVWWLIGVAIILLLIKLIAIILGVLERIGAYL